MTFLGGDLLASSNLTLDLISKKQEVLSANIANVNTPGYKRQDINFSQYLNGANSPLETQMMQKMGPSPLEKESGGEVVVATELTEMQKNSIFYTVAARNMSNVITELKTVLQVGK